MLVKLVLLWQLDQVADWELAHIHAFVLKLGGSDRLGVDDAPDVKLLKQLLVAVDVPDVDVSAESTAVVETVWNTNLAVLQLSALLVSSEEAEFVLGLFLLGLTLVDG